MKDALSLIRSLRPSAIGLVLVASIFAGRASAQPFDLTGHMQHTNLEGGCWILIDYDGKQYEVLGDEELLAAIHKEGVVADLTVEPVKNGASTCMVGEIVRIVKVRNVRMQPFDAPITPTNVSGVVKRSKKGIWYVEQKNGIKYEFQAAPAKKYQRAGAHFKGHVMVNVDPNISREHMDGVIMPEPKFNPPPKKRQK
jgi:hypothetical protein